ncbi:hypothetical protein PBRA_008417 [Plasmodiophora brassicae]|uniref:SUEL-type lectin domain-containing protein n=1 Tax=Plasmodiophora brassicae TaxID=37360 RepID=A0A0G4J0P3_PLABS|nr:hypothetical protein PBRA_008417 [Plasmodiophora brassicae]
MSALATLSLEGNVITSLPGSPSAFASLTNLQSVDMGTNSLTSLPERLFAPCTSLTDFNFGINQLTSIPTNALSTLSQLITINFGTNSIQFIEPGALRAQSLLQTLFLDTNPPLASLPDGLFDYSTSLGHLAIHACPMLMRLPYGIFRNATMLTDVTTYRAPQQIVCWPKQPPSKITGYNDSSGTFGTAVEGAYLSLFCKAPAIISRIIFASYGTPSGQSGVYTLGSCNSINSVSVVRQACVNKTSCLLTASASTFGSDPCPGTTKQLSVAINCTTVPKLPSTKTRRMSTSTKKASSTRTLGSRKSPPLRTFSSRNTTPRKNLDLPVGTSAARHSSKASLPRSWLPRATTSSAAHTTIVLRRPSATDHPSSSPNDVSHWLTDYAIVLVFVLAVVGLGILCIVVVVSTFAWRNPATPGSPLAQRVVPFSTGTDPLPSQHVLLPAGAMFQHLQYPTPTGSSDVTTSRPSQRTRPRRAEARDKFNQGAMTTMSTTSESEPEAL